jgi:hypothetical protein
MISLKKQLLILMIFLKRNKMNLLRWLKSIYLRGTDQLKIRNKRVRKRKTKNKMICEYIYYTQYIIK